ncbi:DNA mismatch repair protein MutT [Candidatus Levyibacteriota bacterium]|nr:NUDIX domain-containing protein [Candidatus Levybacteria bacterium]GDX62451.1 DNA mismatch repair protein MutT [Candidatus Levybacteria bacterium]
MIDDAILYVAQKAVIEKDGKILFLISPLVGLDLPGGKIQTGETDFINSLKREVKEETNMSIDVGRPFYTWYYEFPNNLVNRNKGKKIYCIAFNCKYIDGDIVISDEHQGYEWINKKNILERLREKDNSRNYYLILKSYLSN